MGNSFVCLSAYVILSSKYLPKSHYMLKSPDMTNVYEFNDFRSFLTEWLKNQPLKGRGLLSRWAEKLNVHPTLISQIMGGSKEISLELADELTRLLHLSDEEADYFLLLVQFSRSGSVSLRQRQQRKITEAQTRAKNLAHRLKQTTDFDSVAKAEFYSSWIYAGVRNLTAVPGQNSAEAIADRLQIPREVIVKVIEFLLRNGLCEMKNSQLTYGPQRTHLPATSPLVAQHHRNWREQAEQKMLWRREQDLFFSFPMSLSDKDAELLRQKLPLWIEEVHKIVGPSKSETVRCLNIDYFSY